VSAVFAIALTAGVALACKSAEDEQDRIARLADLTTRQLIAGLNAGNNEVLAKLIVITSTTGGPPRALRSGEVGHLVYSPPPYEYLGAGKPGTIELRDGAKDKRIVRLIQVGKEMKVIASSERPVALGGVQVVRIMQ
jgi:hypothetical protein